MTKFFTLSLLAFLCFSEAFSQNCPNSDFSLLNFDYWLGYTGQNNGGGLGCCPVPGIVPGRHTLITQTMADTNTGGGLIVPPPGYSVCAQLGNATAGHEAERLVYNFTVDPANPAFIFKYAVVLEQWLDEKPVSPYFSYKILNSLNNVIDPLCGVFEDYTPPSTPGFQQYFGAFHAVSWKNWTTVGIDLSAYAGQQLKIQFTTRDCSDGAHFGYAYFITECAKMTIDQSFCQGVDSVVLTAPPDFHYQWNTGDTTQSITVMNPAIGATYICNVISSPGCIFHLTTTIAGTILHPAFTSAHDTCSRTVAFSNSSSINTGNTLLHHWTFGDGTFSNLQDPLHTFPGPGTYNVTLNISTIGGCDSTVTHPVNIGIVPIAEFSVGDTCVAMGAAFHNTSHAQDGIVSWLWDFGDGSLPNTVNWNPSHIYSSPGNYPVTLFVTNQRGCADSITHIIIVYEVPVPAFTSTLPICSGQNTTITFTGSSTPITQYNWNFNGGTIISGSGEGPYEVSFPTGGIQPVELQLTDAMCNSVRDTTINLTVNTTPIANAGQDTNICLGYTITLNGSGGGTYKWAPASGLSNSHIANPVTAPITTTTFTLTVTQNGCSSTDQVIVSVYQLSPVTVTNDTLICEGQKIFLLATGGTNYLWSPANVLNAANIPDPMATLTSTTVFTVTISDNTGCMAIEHVTVALSGAISSAFQITVDTLCQGYNTNIYFNGGSFNPFATYNWDFDGGIVVFGTGNGPFVVHWNTSGIHPVTLTVFEAGCDTSITQKTVTILPGPVVEAGPNDTICAGDNVPLLATGGQVYSWWPTAGLNNPYIANPVATPMLTTMYHVWVYSFGCISEDSLLIYVKPSPNVFAGSDTVICMGDSVQLNATGGLYYTWSPTTGLSSTNVANPFAHPSTSTVYTVVGMGQNGCTADDQILVSVVNKPTSTFIVDNDLVCAYDIIHINYTGSSSATATYTWDFNGATIVSGSGQGPYSIYWTSNGTFNISLIVGESSCLSTESTFSVQVNKVDAVITNFQNIACFGDTNGMASATVTGGSLPYTYTWSNLQNTASINNLLPGTYTVTVTDSAGCSDTTSITLTGPSSKLSLLTNTINITCNYLCDGEISATVSGGTPPYSYLWNPLPAQDTPVATQLCPGTYQITITDNNGCDTTDVVSLIAGATIDASCIADVITGLVPLNVNFTFTGSGANSLSWDFGDNTTSILPNPSHTYTTYGDYQVVLIANSLDPYFCTDTSMILIHAEDTSFINLPNVFTPNNDGFNDNFEMTSHFLESCSITIFNRWGTVVFESKSESVFWNGITHTGNPAPEGTYFYSLDATGKDGRKYKKSGAVTLLR